MCDVVSRLHTRAGQPLSAVQQDRLRSSVVDLPPSARCGVALMLNTAIRAIELQERALAGIGDSVLGDPRELAKLFELDDQSSTVKLRRGLSSFEIGDTFAATQELAIAAHATAHAAGL